MMYTCSPTKPYQVVLEGFRIPQRPWVVLDDISFYQGVCPPPDSNNFEQDWQTWENQRGTDDFDWIIRSGGTASIGTGPSADHTLGTKDGTLQF